MKESDQSVPKMALEEWKEVVGNAATICTIIQFLVGAQVSLSTNNLKLSLTHPLKLRFAWDIIVPSLLEKLLS